MPRIIYVGEFQFPAGDAAAARVLGIGKALRAAGYDLTFIGNWRSGREQDRRADGTYTYQGMRYVVPTDSQHFNGHIALRALRSVRYDTTVLHWLAQQNWSDISAVICYHGMSIFQERLRKLCREKKVPLIADCTEWFQPSHIIGGALGPFRWDAEWRLRIGNRRVGTLIAISSYLQRYYEQRGCRVIRIPPLVDLEDTKWQNLPEPPIKNELQLVYAGTPGKKDLLGNMVQAVSLCRKDGLAVILNIVGCTREAVASNVALQELGELEQGLIIHGRVPQDDVPRYVAAADFSVLLREQARYAQAGFPTKVVESLAAGTPVLCNLTGDLGDYLMDGREALVCDDCTPTALAGIIARAALLTDKQRREMRHAARERAINSFDYHCYGDALHIFVEQTGFHPEATR